MKHIFTYESPAGIHLPQKITIQIEENHGPSISQLVLNEGDTRFVVDEMTRWIKICYMQFNLLCLTMQGKYPDLEFQGLMTKIYTLFPDPEDLEKGE